MSFVPYRFADQKWLYFHLRLPSNHWYRSRVSLETEPHPVKLNCSSCFRASGFHSISISYIEFHWAGLRLLQCFYSSYQGENWKSPFCDSCCHLSSIVISYRCEPPSLTCSSTEPSSSTATQRLAYCEIQTFYRRYYYCLKVYFGAEFDRNCSCSKQVYLW